MAVLSTFVGVFVVAMAVFVAYNISCQFKELRKEIALLKAAYNDLTLDNKKNAL